VSRTPTGIVYLRSSSHLDLNEEERPNSAWSGHNCAMHGLYHVLCSNILDGAFTLMKNMPHTRTRLQALLSKVSKVRNWHGKAITLFRIFDFNTFNFKTITSITLWGHHKYQNPRKQSVSWYVCGMFVACVSLCSNSMLSAVLNVPDPTSLQTNICFCLLDNDAFQRMYYQSYFKTASINNIYRMCLKVAIIH